MQAYKTNVVITDSECLVLTGLPFKVGQRVEVVVTEESEIERQTRLAEMKKLFKEMQAIAEIRGITEEDITREIENYRNGG